MQNNWCCGYLDSINRKWISGLSYEDNTKWDVHKQDTYYYFNEGCLVSFRSQHDIDDRASLIGFRIAINQTDF